MCPSSTAIQNHRKNNNFVYSNFYVFRQQMMWICAPSQNPNIWRNECIDPHILGLGTSWWVVSFTPRPLYPRYPLYRRLGGPQSQSRRWEKWILLTLPGLELQSLGRAACSQSLYRLRYPGLMSLIKYTQIGRIFGQPCKWHGSSKIKICCERDKI
jgi:hypothetical protein